ncbi:MAG: cation transporter [Actinomycetota bacterium]
MPTVYSVPEISCDHCKQTIEGAVGVIDGVRMVHVEVDDRTVSVDGGDDAAIRAAIEGVGFDVAD